MKSTIAYSLALALAALPLIGVVDGPVQAQPPTPAPTSAPSAAAPDASRPAVPSAVAQAAAAPTPAPPEPKAACDAACVRTNADLASQICAPRIEAEAPTDFEWVSRPFAKIFQQADPPEGASPVVRYRGDSIRFLSPQKDWVRVTYECGFDPATRRVDYVRVRLGRLDKPQAPPPVQQTAQNTQRPPVPGPGQPSPAGAGQPPKRIQPGEPSDVEIRQVDLRHKP